ncbi:hypothetical protein B0T25DRAFT_556929 [Lasiosphaeria hispida]|uniref:Uncharacterized protein n=1 Tax=Lasiosphaeria hispida TaxID=260671 RepID=A0AAJ0H9Q5_9PEZI|nr:hypothetical protein B0T25DRAFT_556929 [Lasiosphaeria hispida]
MFVLCRYLFPFSSCCQPFLFGRNVESMMMFSPSWEFQVSTQFPVGSRDVYRPSCTCSMECRLVVRHHSRHQSLQFSYPAPFSTLRHRLAIQISKRGKRPLCIAPLTWYPVSAPSDSISYAAQAASKSGQPNPSPQAHPPCVTQDSNVKRQEGRAKEKKKKTQSQLRTSRGTRQLVITACQTVLSSAKGTREPKRWSRDKTTPRRG